MKMTIALVVLALATASAASARVHHQNSNPAPYSHVDSGWGPPSNWSEIEISHPEGGG